MQRLNLKTNRRSRLKRWLPAQTNLSVAGWRMSDPALVSKLREYIFSGLEAGDTCVVIVNSRHIKQLHEKRAKDNDVSKRLFNDQCIVLNADSMLANFMDDGKLNRRKFLSSFQGLIEEATKRNKPLRVYCEMIAILWEADNIPAAFELGRLWNKLAKTYSFSLVIDTP